MELEHNIIKENHYFKLLTAEAYSTLVEHISIIHLKKHETLFHEGEYADAFYIVKEGVIRITSINAKGKSIVLAKIINGGFFGEQAFSLSSSPRRQATAKAYENSILYKIPREALLFLQKSFQELQYALQQKNLVYIEDKFRKLTDKIQTTSNDIKAMLDNRHIYPERSIIYFQHDYAENTYILLSGEVELRSYNQKKEINQIIGINPGQIFGSSHISKESHHAIYHHTAVVKKEATVIVINTSQYKDHSIIKEIYTHFSDQLVYQNKGKILQFRSEYLNMPVMTSIISLYDNNEIVCQQVIDADIFFAALTNHIKDRVILHQKNSYFKRELSLNKNCVIGFNDYGIWDDSHQLLDCIVNGKQLTEKQIESFIKTGHIAFQSDDLNENLVCKCMRVSYDTINHLISSEEATFSVISQKTGASTVCGGCKPTILQMLGTDTWIPCVLSNVIEHTNDVKSFQFKPTHHKMQVFKPGQYIVIKAKIDNAWVQRNYTLTGSFDLNYYEVTIKKEECGVFSPWLFQQMSENTIFYISGPYGEFVLEKPINSPIVCMMGGIGITPAIAFLRYLKTIDSSQMIYIDYSIHNREQIIFKNEFDTIIQTHKNIFLNYRITTIQGNLSSEEIKSLISSNTGCHVYVCGPKRFENKVIDTFREMNLPSEQLHIEEFSHAGAPDHISQTINLE